MWTLIYDTIYAHQVTTSTSDHVLVKDYCKSVIEELQQFVVMVDDNMQPNTLNVYLAAHGEITSLVIKYKALC